jgi:hypothetical protein
MFLLSCTENEKNKNLITWKEVSYNETTEKYMHNPKYDYTLIFEEGIVIKVIPPTMGFVRKILSIKIVNDSEMDIEWTPNSWDIENISSDTVRSNYEYNDKEQLIISKFRYTIATIPFPNNLTQAIFIIESNLN